MQPAPQATQSASVVSIPTTAMTLEFMIADLAKSGLTPTDIGAPKDNPGLFIEVEPFSRQPIGYRIPYYLPDQQVHPQMYRVRLANPGPGLGKYTQPDKSQFPDGTYPYLPPHNSATHLQGPALIVEGEKKALAAIKFLLRIAYGIGGCWNWSKTDDRGLHRLHPELSARFLPGQRVEIVMDGDIRTNDNVQTAAGTLRRRLLERGVEPTFVLLPPGAKGLDDWCMSVHKAGMRPDHEFPKLERTDGADFLESFIDVWDTLKLVMSASSLPVNNEANVLDVLTKHDWFKGRLRFNTTMKRMEFHSPDGRLYENDHIESYATHWMQKRLGMVRCTSASVRGALSLLSAPGSPVAYNEAADRLRACAKAWDSTARVDTFLVRVLHLPDTPYHRAASRAFFLGAARRAMQPGCKMDYVVILAGKGGVGKTTFFQRIAMNPEWVKEITEGLDRSKDARMALARGWIVEASEGVAFDMASAGGMKSIITDTCDEFRPPYGTSLQRFPRQTVLVASTNDETLLKYEAGSGNRRFLPITLRGRIDFGTVDREIEQVWGEAVVRVQSGEREWDAMVPGGPDLEAVAETEVRAHTEADPWCEDLERFLDDPTHTHSRPWNGTAGHAVSSYDLLTLALRLDPDRKISAHGKRLRRAMQAIGGWQHITVAERATVVGATRKFTGYWKPDV